MTYFRFNMVQEQIDSPARHIQQYQTNDYKKHTDNALDGLSQDEHRLFSKLLRPNAATLEIGCSGGRISFGLEAELKFSDLTAVDVVESFIDFARYQGEQRKSCVQFKVADVTALPYADSSFDQIVAFGVVLSHIVQTEMRAKALAELARVLRPGGLLVINARNLEGGPRLALVRFLMRMLRLLWNPSGLSSSDLPRLGRGGKPDLLFFRSSKPQLHFFRVDEFLHDLVSAGFSVRGFATSQSLNSPRYDSRGYCVCAWVCREDSASPLFFKT